MDTITKKLFAIVKDIKPYAEFDEETDLLKSGILDSLAFVVFINQMEEECDIEVDEEAITSGQFNSIRLLASLIKEGT